MLNHQAVLGPILPNHVAGKELFVAPWLPHCHLHPLSSNSWTSSSSNLKWPTWRRYRHIQGQFPQHCWWCPKIGVPPNHPFIDGFSTINHLFFWDSPLMKTFHVGITTKARKVFLAAGRLQELQHVFPAVRHGTQ